MESSCLVSRYRWGAEFVLHRAEHAQGGVPALSVVEDFQVLKERGGQLQPGPPPSAVEQFDLDRAQKDSILALSTQSPMEEPIEGSRPEASARWVNAQDPN